MHPVLFRLPLPWVGVVPIYTWGVMLGVSLIVGWYLTLGRAQADGLPREMLANAYVVTALAALLGARLLFVATNPTDAEETSIFELRSGGMVAYGGFLGGFIATVLYMRWKKFPLMPWADVGVLSLASGLFFTRIGCWMYGCDFGHRLSETAPAWLKRAGTFPHWPEGTVQGGDGSEPWAHHLEQGFIPPDAEASLPVHPTQLYEAGIGLALLVLLLWMRPHRRFRGQTFLTFVFLYGFARFAIEFLRDDAQRGSVPPSVASHILFPVTFALFAAAFIVGVAPSIRNKAIRLGSQVAFALAPIVTFIKLRPEAYALAPEAKLSTSQFLGLLTAMGAAWAYGVLAKGAAANPEGAMAAIRWNDEGEAKEREEGTGDGEPGTGSSESEKPSAAAEPDADADAEEPKPKPKKKRKKKVGA